MDAGFSDSHQTEANPVQLRYLLLVDYQYYTL